MSENIVPASPNPEQSAPNAVPKPRRKRSWLRRTARFY